MSWMVAPIIFSGRAVLNGVNNNNFNLTNTNVHFLPDGTITALPGYMCDLSAQTTATSWGNAPNLNPHCFFNMVLSTGGYGWLGYVTDKAYDANYLNEIPSVGRFYYANYGGSVYTPFYLSSSFTAQNVDIIQLNDKALIAFNDGVTQPRTYTHLAAALSTITGCPDGKFVDTHVNRAFLANSKYYPNRVWWSGISDPTTWDTGVNGDWADIGKDDGDVITGIRSYLGDLYVFKKNSVSKITGNDFDAATGNFSALLLQGVPGCIEQKSVVLAEGIMYWFSPAGFIAYNGSNAVPIGYGSIDMQVNNRKQTIGTPEGFYDAANHVVFWKDNVQTLAYNVPLKKWSEYQPPFSHLGYGMSNYTFGKIRAGSYSGSNMLFGSQYIGSMLSADIFPYRMGADSDDFAGDARNITLLGRWMDFGTYKEKENLSLALYRQNSASAGSVIMQSNYDFYSTTPETKYLRGYVTGFFGERQKVYFQNSRFRNVSVSVTLSACHVAPQIWGVDAEFSTNDETPRIPDWIN